MASAALGAALRLEEWLDRNGLAGYDPYDVKGTWLGVALQRLGARGGALRMPRRALAQLDDVAPRMLRRALRIEPKENAHARGLVARAQAYLLDVTGDPRHGTAADEMIEWLVAHPSTGYSGLSWGYPFTWQTGVLVPAGTPSGFVSVVAGDALLARFEQTEDERLLDAASRVAQFLVEGLNVTTIGNCVTFSYTPLDDFQVNNVNLLIADFLTRVAIATGREELADLGRRAAALTLAEFRSDGALPYWRREQAWRNPDYLDHYHAGNALRALAGLWESTRETRYRETLAAAFDFYRDAFFGDSVPLTYAHARDPIDVHACAEALHANAVLSPIVDGARPLLDRALAWVLGTMQRSDGAFAYRIRRRFGVQRRNNMVFVRWGEAPMLVGLAAAAKAGA